MVKEELSLSEKSIVLIGFMGVGKTTIGKKVAQKLGRKFIDVDEKIEKEFGMPATEIFAKRGEKAFREKEKEFIVSLSKQPLQVISVGGGAFMQEEVREACLANCLVYYLHLSWEHWQKRIELIIDTRPVLQNKSLEEMKELFEARQSMYAHHHVKVVTDNMTEDEVSDFIIESLTTAWNR